jgi:hypothetical protein
MASGSSPPWRPRLFPRNICGNGIHSVSPLLVWTVPSPSAST